MMKLNENWEFDVFGIDNFNSTTKFSYYYNFIRENIFKIDGDILEVGVYKGRSLLATALLLKELNSDKKVYGFDSFTGFPPTFHSKDDFSNFKKLFKSNQISKSHYENHVKMLKYKNLLKKNSYTPKNISSSESFSDTSYDYVLKKAEILGLDNILLFKGDFSETMLSNKFINNNFMSVMIDCDIYMSYKIALPFAWSRMSNGAFMFLDEYYSLKFPGAKIATDEFFSKINSKPKLISKHRNEFERWGVIKD